MLKSPPGTNTHTNKQNEGWEERKKERERERASSQENKQTHLPGVHVRPHVVVVVVVLAKAELRCVRSHSFYVVVFCEAREKFKNSSRDDCCVKKQQRNFILAALFKDKTQLRLLWQHHRRYWWERLHSHHHRAVIVVVILVVAVVVVVVSLVALFQRKWRGYRRRIQFWEEHVMKSSLRRKDESQPHRHLHHHRRGIRGLLMMILSSLSRARKHPVHSTTTIYLPFWNRIERFQPSIPLPCGSV